MVAQGDGCGNRSIVLKCRGRRGVGGADLATLEREVVTREEFETTLRGLATKGDIKVVVDRIQAVEGRLTNVEVGLADLKRDVSDLKEGLSRLRRDLVLSLAAVNVVAVVAIYVALTLGS